MTIAVLVAVGLAVVVFIGAVIFAGVNAEGPPRPEHDAAPEDILARERIFARSAAQMLGRYLADLAPGANALAILADANEMSSRHAELDGLKEGFTEGLGESVNLVAVDYPNLAITEPTPAASNSFGDMLPPLENLKSVHFTDLLTRHPECKVVVSFIGLPPDLGDMPAWAQEPDQRPLLAVANGPTPLLRNALLGEAVVAAVLPHPDRAGGSQVPPSDIEEAFAQRYLLATPDNADELAEQYPQLLAN